MREFYVVDGYNIIYAWPEFEKMLEKGLEHSRDKLINILANFAGFDGNSITVVFDAHLVKSGVGHHEIVHGIEVYYTQEGETADALIERIVGDLGKMGNVHVVTSDWDEQKIIFGRGAYRVTPKEFRSQVMKANKQGQEKFNKTNPTEGYLEDKLPADIRVIFEKWRRRKD
ncbi:NYN domain-containing protein [Desulfotomaculum sp. 1211_IL3151]|uniref:NYN domain-containing protein n=1 Tax=Desulfotomaculum sp. 1211_IL3151 TaxID=3084055 RepID=UPI002FD98BDF